MNYKIVALGTILAATAFNAEARADVTWTFGGINPPNAPVTIASKRFAELVNERTDGRVHINFYEGSQLGNGPSQIEAMAIGAQEGYISSGSNASNLVKEYGIVDMPFVFESQQHFNNFMNSDLAEGLHEKMRDEYNVRILASNWYREPRVILSKNACINGPEEIEGKRARSPNLPMFVAGWEALDAVPVTISYGETYMGLSQGIANITESAGEQVYSSKFYEVLPFITEAEMAYPQNSVYIAESAFQTLSDEDKNIVTQAAQEAGDYFVELVQENTEPQREKMGDEGVTFCELSQEGRRNLTERVANSVDTFEEKGLLPEGWWEKIQAMK